MKSLLTSLVLILSLSANSQITSFIKHGDTVYCYFPSTRDSIRVNYSAAAGSASWGGILGTLSSQADLISVINSLVHVTDTATMLSPYARTANVPSVTGKVNYTDTATMLSPYARTATIPSVTGKVNYTDTATMLTPYQRSAVATATFAPIASPTFTGTVSGITATMVGLGNVNNTSDANKPVSTATQTAISALLPSKVASVDIAATSSATTTTTLFTPTSDGMYRISVFLKLSTTGTSPVAGPVTITYTDADGSVAQSHVMLLQSVTGTVVTTTVNNSTTTGTVNGSMIVNAKSGVAIQYAIAVSGTFGAGRYVAHLVCEKVK